MGRRAINFRIRTLLAACLVALVALSGCETPKRLDAVPLELTVRAIPSEGPVRYWPDEDPAPLLAEARASFQRELDWRASTGQTGPPPPVAFLAISGGGDDGAFGAGLLAGWTQAGDRPDFKLVTGVSTGALIAPFAFLGPRYDPYLKKFYTTVTAKDIFKKRNLLAALFNDALTDTTPLAQQINAAITPQMVAEIGTEYAKGRMLFVGTTNLDAGRGVIWNMGAIAQSKDPHALTLFRKVVLASASIPGLFPPVMIDVTVDGKHYQEMHVDGGATNQVFMYPETLDVNQDAPDIGALRVRAVYIIRNAKLDSGWSNTDRRTLKIVGLAVSSLIHNQGLGDLTRMYMTATRDHIDYNLAFIPKDFSVVKMTDFDPAYMRPLFDRGFDMAQHGYPWLKAPPGLVGPLDPTDGATARKPP